MIFYKEKFRALRESRGLTLKDVAIQVGVSEGTVCKWETKSNFQPRASKIERITQILGCDASEIVDFSGPLEKHLDAMAEEDKQVKNLLFGADVADLVRQIRLAKHRRDNLSDTTEEIAEENTKIRHDMQIMFDRLSQALGISENTKKN